MALDGLIVLACAALPAAPPTPAAVPAPTSRQAGLDNTLEVQAALKKARELLLRRDARGAVAVLEAHLARINGNREYLLTLRDAYRQHVKDLVLSDRPAAAERYRQRLAILDPDAARSLAPGGAERVRNAPVTEAAGAPQVPVADAPGSPKGPVFRAKRPDDDPFDSAFQAKGALPAPAAAGPAPAPSGAALRLVERAEEAFRQKRFGRALALFEEAHRADQKATAGSRGRWAYCKLHGVVERLNRPGPEAPAWSELEGEVRLALEMAPGLEKTGQWLLQEIRDRRGGAGPGAGSDVAVRHTGQGPQGWAVAETVNFRVFHHQARDLAEKAARVAEQTRAAMIAKWFGGGGGPWNPRCDLYLHADGASYSRLTGVSASSPGHSRIELDRRTGRVVLRRIDLRCDSPNALTAVLPHEATHVVLAGQFGKHNVPRWADEGMAVLTEPADRVAQHRRNLARCHQGGQLFSARELMGMEEYPRAARVAAFYAQSVSLVDFLARARGPEAFTQFLRDAVRDGYEAALAKHYQLRSFEDLEAAWSRQAFGAAGDQMAGLSGRSR